MRTYTRINEDFLDNHDAELDDEVSMRDEICSEIDLWMYEGTQPSFDVQMLPDGFYPVYNKDVLSKIIELCMSLYGNECDLNWIDVSKVEDMSYLFAHHAHATFNGDISKWNVSRVTYMMAMFKDSYFNGDISKWNVSRVTNMTIMFDGSKFNGDISGWDVSRVTNMAAMFKDSYFNSVISGWDVSHVRYMQLMFLGCPLFNSDISSWDTSSVIDMHYMFSGADNFNQDLSKWNVSRVKNMKGMFCNSAIDCDLSGWNVSKVWRHDDMFTGCPLENMPDRQPKFKVNEDFLDNHDSELDDKVSMHDEICSEIDRWIEDGTPLSFDIRRLPDAFFPVKSNEQLRELIKRCCDSFGSKCDLNWVDVSGLTDFSWLFFENMFNGDISRWNVSNITDMSYMFYSSMFNNDISGWNVSNVNDMTSMFRDSVFNSDISKWDISNVVSMSGMFTDSQFNRNISSWDLSGVKYKENMFLNCPIRAEFKPLNNINEDFLDRHDIQSDSLNVLDDARAELDDWLHYGKEPSFNPEILPDGFYPVKNKNELIKVIVATCKDYGYKCSLNWIDVSHIDNMTWLFCNFSMFNGDISRWDVSNVEDMQAMFYGSDFNGDVSRWDVSKVSKMRAIFHQCPFCHDISMWNCASMDPGDLMLALKGSQLPEEFKPKAR